MSKARQIVAMCLVAGAASAGPLGYGDPTQPTPNGRPAVSTSGEAVVVRPRWTLSSTIVAGDRHVAVINGRSVALGATIEGARLLSVDASGAWIQHQGRRIRLDMAPSAGKTITAKTPAGR